MKKFFDCICCLILIFLLLFLFNVLMDESKNIYHEIKIQKELNYDKEIYIESRAETYFKGQYVGESIVIDGRRFYPAKRILDGLNLSYSVEPRQLLKVSNSGKLYNIDYRDIFGMIYLEKESLAKFTDIENLKINIKPEIAAKYEKVDLYLYDDLVTRNVLKLGEEYYIPAYPASRVLNYSYSFNFDDAVVVMNDKKYSSSLIGGRRYLRYEDVEEALSLYEPSFGHRDSKKASHKVVRERFRGEKIVFSFDDYLDQSVLEIMDILDKEKIQGIFFVIGNSIAENKGILLEIEGRGHLIGNHTFNHLNLLLLSEDELRAEIVGFDLELRKLGIERSEKILRPPGGFYDKKVKEVAEDLGYRIVLWSLNSSDADLNNDSEVVKRLVNNYIREGALVAFHTKRESTIEALPDIIKNIYDENLEVLKK